MFGLSRRLKDLEEKVERHEERLNDHDDRIAALESWEDEAKDLLLGLPRFQIMTDARLNEAMANIDGLVTAYENLEAQSENESIAERGRRLVQKLIRVQSAARRELDGREVA